MNLATRQKGPRTLYCIIPVFAGTLHAQLNPSHGQTISITESRPLAAIAEQLTGRYGVPVSYEDPLTYPFEDDLGETINIEHRRGFPSIPALSPKSGTLTFVAEPLGVDFNAVPARTADPAAVARILQDLLAQHEANGNPGRFKMLQTKAGLVIVPTETRDALGHFAPSQSLLDTRISFPEVRGDLYSVLEAFTKALTVASGKQVSFPFGGLGMSGPVSANNEPARDVLVRIVTGLLAYGRINGGVPPPKAVAWTLIAQPGIYPPYDATYRMDLLGGALNIKYVLESEPPAHNRTVTPAPPKQ